MLKRIALLLVGLSTVVIVMSAPAQAGPVRPAYDTNWPCDGC
jgi:hypothetical protein